MISSIKRALQPFGFKRFAWARRLNTVITARPRTIKRNGLILKLDRYDGGGVSSHDHPGLELLLTNMKSDDRVLDVGPHIGYYALRMAQKAQWVYCLEASRETFAILVENILRNRANVTPMNIAADRKTGTAHWTQSEALALSSLIEENTDKNFAATNTTIPTISLDDFPFPFTVLKLDAEGADMRILEGGKKALKRIRMLLVECWPWALKRAGYQGRDLVSLLKKHFDTVIDSRTGRHPDLSMYPGEKDYTDLFAIKKR